MSRFDIADKRVHACLYFIAPTGHGLKPLDVEVMKKIHKKVNIIPVIGKADSCTVKEVNMFKTKVRQKQEVNSIIFHRKNRRRCFPNITVEFIISVIKL